MLSTLNIMFLLGAYHTRTFTFSNEPQNVLHIVDHPSLAHKFTPEEDRRTICISLSCLYGSQVTVKALEGRLYIRILGNIHSSQIYLQRKDTYLKIEDIWLEVLSNDVLQIGHSNHDGMLRMEMSTSNTFLKPDVLPMASPSCPTKREKSEGSDEQDDLALSALSLRSGSETASSDASAHANPHAGEERTKPLLIHIPPLHKRTFPTTNLALSAPKGDTEPTAHRDHKRPSQTSQMAPAQSFRKPIKTEGTAAALKANGPRAGSSLPYARRSIPFKDARNVHNENRDCVLSSAGKENKHLSEDGVVSSTEIPKEPKEKGRVNNVTGTANSSIPREVPQRQNFAVPPRIDTTKRRTSTNSTEEKNNSADTPRSSPNGQSTSETQPWPSGYRFKKIKSPTPSDPMLLNSPGGNVTASVQQNVPQVEDPRGTRLNSPSSTTPNGTLHNEKTLTFFRKRSSSQFPDNNFGTESLEDDKRGLKKAKTIHHTHAMPSRCSNGSS